MMDAIACVLPMNNKWYIGKDNDLLFKIPNDLEFFRNAQSKYHTLICGYNTYKTLPSYVLNREDAVINVLAKHHKPLVDHKKNIRIISKDELPLFCTDVMERALVIGGGETYRMCLPYISNFFITSINNQTKYTEEDLLGSTHIPNLGLIPTYYIGDVIGNYDYPEDNVQNYSFVQLHNIRNDELAGLMPKNVLANSSMYKLWEGITRYGKD